MTGGVSPFPLLFSPVTLNRVTIRNRIVSTAHATCYAVAGTPRSAIAPTTSGRRAAGSG
jgi:2,4-dienoyl-CoA reductase-like NADH-dependent reductase (Old Yellow Enzyme family)